MLINIEINFGRYDNYFQIGKIWYDSKGFSVDGFTSRPSQQQIEKGTEILISSNILNLLKSPDYNIKLLAIKLIENKSKLKLIK